MCGRYDLTELPVEYFNQLMDEAIADRSGAFTPRYNVAPTQPVPIIRRARETQELEVVTVRWGLLPYWSKTPKLAYSTINARAETVEKAPAFRGAFERRRCLVPATGWYEWQEIPGNPKQPWRIRRAGGRAALFAGLWDRWKGGGQVIESCTIVVTDAVQVLQDTHDRMPVLLDKEKAQQWLNPDGKPTELKALLQANPAIELEMYPVSTRVNNARNEEPGLIEPIHR